jgi:hypothetical protein
MICESFRRERDPKCREKCGRKACGYVISGPMFVCHTHARYWRGQGEEINLIGGSGW